MFCSNCGKKIPDDSKFCEKCGAVQENNETVETQDELDKTIVLMDKTDDNLDKTLSLEETNENTEEISLDEDKNLEQPEVSEEKVADKEEVIEDVPSVEETVEQQTNEYSNDKKVDVDDEKEKLAGSHTMLLSNLDDAVADLKPDDFDELMPKSSNARIIAIITLLLITAIGVGIYFFIITPKEEKEKTNKTNYQAIINEYGKSIEKVAKEYLLDHEIISDYSEIKSLVKYNNHKVSCKNVYVNIDGTVYLSDCTVDGVKVEEGYGKKKNILTKTGEDACNVKYNKVKKQLEFYTEDKLTSVYECDSSDCGLYEQADFKYNSCLDSIALIKDGKKIYLYSYEAGQKLFEAFSEIVPINLKNNNQTLIVKDYFTEKYGYVTLKGTQILKTEYDALGIIKDGKLLPQGVDLDNDIIIAAKNNKYGVINLSTGKQVINYFYKDMYLAPNNNYIGKYGSKYYLVDSKDEKVLKESYEMIFAFDKVIVVKDNNKLRFIDYNEKNIIEDTIDVSGNYDIRNENNDYNVYENDNMIMIDVYKSKNNMISYTYNQDKKELTKLTEDTNSNSNSNSNNSLNSNVGEE